MTADEIFKIASQAAGFFVLVIIVYLFVNGVIVARKTIKEIVDELLKAFNKKD